MPSDEKAGAVLSILAEPAGRFSEAVMLSIEDVQGFLATHRDPEEDATTRVQAELGSFAAGRIDTERFAALMQDHQELDHEVRHELEVALETLTRLHERGDKLFGARVAPGGDLRDTVARAYAEIGKAFAAARLVRAAQAGGGEEELDASKKGFPFRNWSAEERAIAPPVVVTVHGEDLEAGGLSEFMDGSAKVVLVVDGSAPVAPLSGLLFADRWVEQTGDPADLSGLAGFDGPGVAAVLPEGAATFRHDPGAAPALTVTALPDEAPRHRVGITTPGRQAADLNHLRNWDEASASGPPPGPAEGATPASETPAPAAAPAAAAAAPESPATPPAPAAPDEAGQLAGWLLQQAGLGG
jgi:hypothetical protein